MGAALALLGGVPRWVYEALGAAALVAAIYLSGVFHEKQAIEVRTIKQQVAIEHQVIVTDHAHDQELADLRTYRAAHPVTGISVCHAGNVPQGTAQGPAGAPAGDVQQVPARDSGEQRVAGLLDLLANRADGVSAELRRRQELEP